MYGNSNQITTTVPSNKLFVPQELGQLRVTYRGREFFVVQPNGSESSIARMDLSPELREISEENLQKILNVGNLAIAKIGEDYALRFNGKLSGGGPLGAFLAYVGTNIAGGALMVIGTVTAPIGGAPLVAVGIGAIAAAPVILVAGTAAPTP